MSIIELNTAAKTLMEVRAMIKELESEAEALTDQIKSVMVDRGEEVLTGDGWTASWKNVTSSRFDSKSFKADNPDMYAAYSKATTTCRFVLSL